MAEVLARMTARDGLPFSVFRTSSDLRSAIQGMGLQDKLPTSPNSVRKIVTTFADSIRLHQIEEMATAQQLGRKFSVIFDEWTSTMNRRYLNLIIKCQSSLWNAGLIRICGSFTSERCLTLVDQKIASYKLSMTHDVVSIITDGTSMMTKIGRLSTTSQQLCLAHGIQLAVTDVLYKRSQQVSEAEGHDYALYEDESEDDEEFEGEPNGLDGLVVDRELITVDVTNTLIAPMIAKVRKVIRMFTKSALKNEKLQKYVQEDFKKELQLKLD